MKEQCYCQEKLPEDFTPGPSDVICSRGKAAKSHIGNVQYRKLVESYMERYVRSTAKLQKMAIIAEIVTKVRVRSPKGGFVKQKDDGRWYEGTHHQQNSSLFPDMMSRQDLTTLRFLLFCHHYILVGDHFAREKVSQSLRDSLHVYYRSSCKSKTIRRAIRREKEASAKKDTSVEESEEGGRSSPQQESASRQRDEKLLEDHRKKEALTRAGGGGPPRFPQHYYPCSSLFAENMIFRTATIATGGAAMVVPGQNEVNSSFGEALRPSSSPHTPGANAAAANYLALMIRGVVAPLHLLGGHPSHHQPYAVIRWGAERGHLVAAPSNLSSPHEDRTTDAELAVARILLSQAHPQSETQNEEIRHSSSAFKTKKDKKKNKKKELKIGED